MRDMTKGIAARNLKLTWDRSPTGEPASTRIPTIGQFSHEAADWTAKLPKMSVAETRAPARNKAVTASGKSHEAAR